MKCVKFTCGNCEGQYFRPKAFSDVLKPMAGRIADAVGRDMEFHLRYDAEQDYHYLEWEVGGHKYAVRYYRVFSFVIDGEDHWSGCPTYSEFGFVRCIRDQVLKRLLDSEKPMCQHGCGIAATMVVWGQHVCTECGHHMQGVKAKHDDTD